MVHFVQYTPMMGEFPKLFRPLVMTFLALAFVGCGLSAPNQLGQQLSNLSSGGGNGGSEVGNPVIPGGELQPRLLPLILEIKSSQAVYSSDLDLVEISITVLAKNLFEHTTLTKTEVLVPFQQYKMELENLNVTELHDGEFEVSFQVAEVEDSYDIQITAVDSDKRIGSVTFELPLGSSLSGGRTPGDCKLGYKSGYGYDLESGYKFSSAYFEEIPVEDYDCDLEFKGNPITGPIKGPSLTETIED